MILPSLLYGCEIYANCDILSKHRLVVLFNNVTRFVFNSRSQDNISISTLSNHIFGIDFLRYLESRVLLLLHKIIYTHLPTYLYRKLTFLRSSRNLLLLAVKYNLLISKRQFFINAIRLWNALEPNIKFKGNVTQFKRDLLGFYSRNSSRL